MLIQIIHFLINIGNGLECNDQMKNIESQSSMQLNVLRNHKINIAVNFLNTYYELMIYEKKTIIKINRKYKIHVNVN